MRVSLLTMCLESAPAERKKDTLALSKQQKAKLWKEEIPHEKELTKERERLLGV